MDGFDLGLRGRVAIVTGGGQGLGRAYAKGLAAVGATVVVADIDAPAGEAVVREIAGAGGRAIAIAGDAGEEAAVERMVARVVAEFGRIDVLVNNAGIYMKNAPPATRFIRRPFWELPLEEWNHVQRVNVTSAFLCARAASPHMRRAKWGRIINVSSTTVMLGLPNYLHYVTSKAAIVGMTRAMARELGADGITVNCLVPGLTPTEGPNPGLTQAVLDKLKTLQCIPRVETPGDLVPAVLFLASEGAGFVTGQSLLVDGGSAFV